MSLPDDVQDDAGYNLDLVQQGRTPELSFGPLHHLGSGVMELCIDEDTDTYHGSSTEPRSRRRFSSWMCSRTSRRQENGFRKTSGIAFSSDTHKHRK